MNKRSEEFCVTSARVRITSAVTSARVRITSAITSACVTSNVSLSQPSGPPMVLAADAVALFGVSVVAFLQATVHHVLSCPVLALL